jgi:DNA primase
VSTIGLELRLRSKTIAAIGIPVTVWTDGDQAGQTATVRSHDTLVKAGIRDAEHVQVLGIDPSDALQLTSAQDLTNTLTQTKTPLAQTVIDHHLDRLGPGAGLERQLQTITANADSTARLTSSQQANIAHHLSQGRHRETRGDEHKAPAPGPSVPGCGGSVVSMGLDP